jgi:hypothetical protein
MLDPSSQLQSYVQATNAPETFTNSCFYPQGFGAVVGSKNGLEKKVKNGKKSAVDPPKQIMVNRRALCRKTATSGRKLLKNVCRQPEPEPDLPRPSNHNTTCSCRATTTTPQAHTTNMLPGATSMLQKSSLGKAWASIQVDFVVSAL